MTTTAWIFSILTFGATPLFASDEKEPKLFDGMGKSIVDSFTGTNIFLHLSAFAATPLLIRAGTDARVYDTFRETPNDAAWPGAILGSGAGAIAAGGWLYLSGTSSGDRESIGAAFAIAQASLVTVSYVTFLKSLTGRAHPTNTSPLSSQEQSEQFEFGFRRLGIGYGWPSGHVSHTVAVTSALAFYYPEKLWLKWFSLGLSSYMLFTVSAFHSGQMHWFSDGVAGAFVGYAIGSSVGKNHRRQIDGITDKESSAVSWMPVLGSDYFGATAALAF